ncbi:MAG: T9SS type A sorting domain-containing protein [Chitinophagales bacterium]|nr:T9SS type A sorting domain-containing protein [Bacteroidota bacterium]
MKLKVTLFYHIGLLLFFGTFFFLSFKVNAACPENPSIAISNNFACSGDTISLSAYFGIENDGGTFEWFGNNGIDSVSNPQAIVLSNNACQPLTYTFTATAFCTETGEQVPFTNTSNTISVIVFPNAVSSYLIQTGAGSCTTTLAANQSLCGNYVQISNGGIQVAEPGTTGTHTYTVSYNYLGSGLNCVPPYQVSIPYNCGQQSTCFTVESIGEATQMLCNGSSPSFAAVESEVTINDPDNTFFGFAWYSDAAFQNPININTYVAQATQMCNVSETTLYLAARCNLNNELIAAGSLHLQIVPDYAENLISATNNECEVPQIVSLCPNYIIVPISVPSVVTQGMSGLASWQIEDIHGCWSEFYAINYNCPEIIDNCENFDLLATSSCLQGVNDSYLLQMQVINGTPPYTFSGSYTQNSTNTALHSIAFDNNTAYSITVTDAQNCTATISGTYDCSTCIANNDVGYQLTCNADGSYNINVVLTNGTPPFVLSNGETVSEAVFSINNIPAATDYNLTITDNLQCQVNLAVAAPNCCTGSVSFANNNAQLICSGDAIDLDILYNDLNAENVLVSVNGNNGLGEIENINNIVLENTQSCEAVVYTFTLAASCLDTGETVSGSGSEITVVVLPYIQAFVSTQATACQIILTSSCTNFIISGGNEQGNIYTATENTQGSTTFTITNTQAIGACTTTQIIQTYNCPSQICQANAGTLSSNIPNNTFCPPLSSQDYTITPSGNSQGAYVYALLVVLGDDIIYKTTETTINFDAIGLPNVYNNYCIYGLTYSIDENINFEALQNLNELEGSETCYDLTDCSLNFTVGEVAEFNISTEAFCSDLDEISFGITAQGSSTGLSNIFLSDEAGNNQTLTAIDNTELIVTVTNWQGNITVSLQDAISNCLQDYSLVVAPPAGGCSAVNCTNSGGQIFPSDTLKVCPGQVATIQANNVDLGEDDALLYVLYDQANPTNLENPIAASYGIGNFSSLSSINILYNTTYFASAISGPDNGEGLPDLTHPCSELILPATPIIFLPPSMSGCEVIGIENIAENGELFVQYLSTSQQILVQNNDSQADNYRLTLYNLQGKIITQSVWKNALPHTNYYFSLPTCPSGLYILGVEKGQGVQSFKVPVY